MTIQPFAKLIDKLPRFSRLVKRSEFLEALKVLTGHGRVRMPDRTTVTSADGYAQRLLRNGDYSPWKLSGGPAGIGIMPSFIKVPGMSSGIFPNVNGISILNGASLTGSGFVCLVVHLSQAPRAMNWIFQNSGEDVLSAVAHVHLLEENTVKLSGVPEIIITSDTGSPSVPSFTSMSASSGRYVIPLGYVATGVLLQFISRPLQIGLRAGFLHVTEL